MGEKSELEYIYQAVKDTAHQLGDLAQDKSYYQKHPVTILDAEVEVRSPSGITPYEELGAIGGVSVGGQIAPDTTRSMVVVEEGYHGRAMVESKSKGIVLYGDENSWYTVRDSKGANYSDSAFRVEKTKSGHIRVDGMYNESEADYLLKVTEFLAQHGILTERIRVVWRLNEMVNRDKIEKITDWKERTIKILEKSSFEDANEFREYIENVNLVTVERDLQVAERIRDLSGCVTKDVFKKNVR